MSWSSKRQFIILGALTILGLLVIFIVVLPFFTRAPSCIDGKKNGTEEGIDCGGSCSIICSNTANTPLVLWARSFPVTGSVYNAVAYVENQNVGAGVQEINYDFRLYDSMNLFITERTGSTYIGKEGATAIFEGDINVGLKVPKRTTFTFTTKNPVWTKISPEAYHSDLHPDASQITDEFTRPKVTGTLTNPMLFRITDVDVIAILYGADGNAVGVSKTFFDAILPASKENLYFTWPHTFSLPVTRIEFIPRFNPFTLSFPNGYVDPKAAQ